MTILYRTNAQSRIFEEGLLRYNIPHKVFGGISFYSRAEIKDIVAYLSVIVNPNDELNLRRILNVPKRKLGDRGLDKIKDLALNKNITLFEGIQFVDEISGITSITKIKLKELYEMIKEFQELLSVETSSSIVSQLIEKIGYIDYIKENYDNRETRIENIEEFQNSILELENLVGFLKLNEYLENISLVSATDDLEESVDYVKLMTIHNSKGLEFPIVFLVGMENEIFPGTKIFIDESEIEEERRLCYVAITRAEKKLYLSYAKIRFMYGTEKSMTKSKFIDEIPKKLCDIEENKDFIQSFETEENKKNKHETKLKFESKNLISAHVDKNKVINNLGFKIGDRVMHKKFGLGVLREITEKKLVVQFVDGTKDIAMILAEKFLEKVN